MRGLLSYATEKLDIRLWYPADWLSKMVISEPKRNAALTRYQFSCFASTQEKICTMLDLSHSAGFRLSIQFFPHVFLNDVCGKSQTALSYKYLQHIVGLILLCLNTDFLRAFYPKRFTMDQHKKHNRQKTNQIAIWKMTTWKAELETADDCWSELHSNAGNPDCKFNALNARVHPQITSGLLFKTEPKMLFSVSARVWERGVESLNMLACSVIYLNYEQSLRFFISLL